MTTVLIVGAGPVGLTLALELARYGVPLRIVDKAPARSTTSKALVLWSRSLELLERSGCVPALLAAGNRVTSATISAGKDRIARVTLEDVASPYPFALMLPQSETERLLEAHLNGLGITVERDVELVRFSSRENVVSAALRDASGDEQEIAAEWLVGCDGAHSTVRHQLHMEFIGDTLPSDWILADVHLAGVSTPASELEMIWHEDGVLAMFPISGERYRVIADVGPADGAAPPPTPTLADVQAIIERRGPGHIVASDPVWLAPFRINERKVADYRLGRVFLAGDAAHVHSPAGGQGMNTGMQDAFNLAWKLALVCRATCAPEPLLESYSTERSAVATNILAATGRLTALAVTKNPAVQFIRNHAARLAFGLAPAREMAADTLSEVSIGYERSALNRQIGRRFGAPDSGSRAPIRSDEKAVGAGDAPRFALFAEANAASAQFLARHAEIVEPDARAPFGANNLCLVRPDGYVGLVASSGAWNDANDYFETVLPGVHA